MSSVPAALRTVSLQSPGATRIVLVRHGQAECNVAGVVGGPNGCTGLTELGEGQAITLRRRLEETGELQGATALYSSTLARARQTAELISPAVGGGRLQLHERCGLCELHPGQADGLTWAQFSEAYPEPNWDVDPDTALAPGAESWSGFVARAADALSELAHEHRGQLVVVVCHAGVIESAMLKFLPLDLGRIRLTLRTEHVSLTEFEHTEPEGWRLLRYNDAAHLGLEL